MSPAQDQAAATIHRLAAEVGASACGITIAQPVDPEAQAFYSRWIAQGNNATMQYCAKYDDVRNDPRLLLEGTRTVIVCAFNYFNPTPELPLAPRIARYAWGADYHHVVKERLHRLASALVTEHGGECRVLTDTAPMRERYWARRAGVGFIGVNNTLIVPSVGSYVFLGEVLWTGEASADYPCEDSCLGCGVCVKACPGRALDGQGGCDARRCLSYLTIEHRGDLPDGVDLGSTAYGCDKCQEVCPHNVGAPTTTLPEFKPDAQLLNLTEADFSTMTSSHFKRITRHSAMQRVTLSQLLRNLHHGKKP